MRDKNRIKPFLEVIERIWEENPDWRFMQLICNMQRAFGSDCFYTEDEEIIEKMKEYFHTEEDKCRTCEHFIGNGDWNLCCTEPHDGYPFGFLCYETTPSCEKYKKKEEK